LDHPSGDAPAPSEGCFRIASWNCQGGIPRKARFLASLRPDLAVIPEAGPTALTGLSLEWAPAHAALAGPRPELGVFTFGGTTMQPREPHPEDARSPAIVADVGGPLLFTVLAVCARQSGSGPHHRRYAASLLAAIERHAGDLRGPLVVAGDFNTAAALDDGRGVRAHRDVVDALAGLGLTSAWHHLADLDHGAEDRGTFHMYRHTASPPLHLDYCFVPDAWLPRLRTAWIGPPDPWLSRSDHLPLVVDVALAPT
jgi:endonuclease/exonuclease/phosphatase (EEP) superfamily protein YafD